MRKQSVYIDISERCGWSEIQNKLFVNLDKGLPRYYEKVIRLKALPNAVRNPGSNKFYIPVENFRGVIEICNQYGILKQSSIIKPIEHYKLSKRN